MKARHKLLAAAVAVAGAFAAPVQAVPVALELALLVDVSGSVDATEYNLQKTGYVNAFNNASIQNAIANLTGGIAVTYIEWGSSNEQATLVGWTHLTDAASSSAFATAIANSSRAFTGLTAPGSALNYVSPFFATNDFEGDRWVIDVSGDGEQNDGTSTSAARDAFLASAPNGVTTTINGLCIGGNAVCTWYENNIRGGTNSFVTQAADFTAFDSAVVSKIGREVNATVPVPATAALLGIGLIAASVLRRRNAS